MGPEEEIYEKISTELLADGTLFTLLGNVLPDVNYFKARANRKPPFFVYSLSRGKNEGSPIYSAKLTIRAYFYSPNAQTAYDVEEQVINMFNNKTFSGTTLKNCRFWHNTNDRKLTLNENTFNKDRVPVNELIPMEVVFDVRYIAITRGNNAIYPLG